MGVVDSRGVVQLGQDDARTRDSVFPDLQFYFLKKFGKYRESCKSAIFVVASGLDFMNGCDS